MGDFQRISVLSLNQESIVAIDSAIEGYLAVIKKRNPAPSDSIEKLRAIRLKLAPFIIPGGFPKGTTLFLSHVELRLVAEAIRGFIKTTRLIIPSSTERDAVLQEFEKLHQYIQTLFTYGMN